MKKELKYWFFAAAILFFANTDLWAQNPMPKNATQDEIKGGGKPAASGTYQFVVIPVEKGDPFTSDYLVMIENYRTGLLWNLFTSCPEIKSGMLTLGFTAPYL